MAPIEVSRMRRTPSRCLLVAALAASPAAAQNQGLVVRDGTLGSGDRVVGPGVDPTGMDATYLITPEMGEQRGSNLFHSFATFGIGENETATFTGPDPIDGPQSVSNVISRVTGGDPSEIDGTLRSTIPGADVWLLNPSGVVFGEGAQLDVPGSFHASTGDYVGFEGGLERFYGDPSRPSVLSTAPPEAFGFLGQSAAAPISVTGTTLDVAVGETLELAGGDVTLTGATLDAPRGAISIRGGRIVVEEGSKVLAETGDEKPAGTITVEASESVLVDDSLLSVSTHATGNAGTIRVKCPEVTFQNGPGLPLYPESPRFESEVGARAETTGSGRGGLIDIDAGSLTLTNGVALSATALSADVASDPGMIQITGGSMELSNSSWLGAGAWGNTGNAGTVMIDLTGTLRLDSGALRGAGLLPYAFISTFAGGARAHGDIDITAGSVELVNGGRIGGCTFCTSNRLKDAANVRIEADRMAVEGVPDGAHWEELLQARAIQNRGSEASAVSVNTSDDGDAGTIEITTSSLELREGGYLGASSWHPTAGPIPAGNAGDIKVAAADSLVIEGSPGVFSGIWTGAVGEGRRGGTITIDSGSVSISKGGTIHATADGSGNGGTITIDSDWVSISDGGVINSNAGDGSGNGGTITIDADSLTLSEGGFISANTSGSGDGGHITIDADSLLIRSRDPRTISAITAETNALYESAGDAGTIGITSRTLVIERGGIVSAFSNAPGDAGTITVRAETVRIGPDPEAPRPSRATREQPAFISASSITPLGADFTAGNAGVIDVQATSSILLTDAGDRYFPTLGVLLLTAQQASPLSGIFSATVEGGDGGSVRLEAPEITVTHGAEVATSSVGGGKGGTIELHGDRLLVAHGGFVDSSTIPHPANDHTRDGDAGAVTLDAAEWIEVSGSHPHPRANGQPSRVSSGSAGSGRAGAVTLDAPLVLLDGGAVATLAAPSWHGLEGIAGGDVTLVVEELIVRRGGRIDASTFIPGPGGTIDVTASESILVEGEGSGIESRTGGSGRSGDVTLRASVIEIRQGGEVLATSEPGDDEVKKIYPDTSVTGDPPEVADGDAGSVTLIADREVRLGGGTIATNAATANGGNITIQAKNLVHLDAGEITASVGGGDGGNIFIGNLVAPDLMILQSDDGNPSSIVATAVGGSGGRIEISADNYFAFPHTVVSAKAQDPALSGTVEVHTPDVSLAGQLTALPSSYLDAASLMKAPCAARRSGERAGSFAVRGSDGIPAEPDGWLPAAMAHEAPRGAVGGASHPSWPTSLASLPLPGSCP